MSSCSKHIEPLFVSNAKIFVKKTGVSLNFATITPIHASDLSPECQLFSVNGSSISLDGHPVASDAEPDLYSFNDESPFFTASQPFWTSEGWKSVDPVASSIFFPRMRVTKLYPGDHVFRLDDDNDNLKKIFTDKNMKHYHSVFVSKINHCSPSVDKRPLYRVASTEGSNTILANNYVVALQTTCIPSATIVSNVQRALDLSERVRLCATVRNNRHLFRSALGESLLSSLEEGVRAADKSFAGKETAEKSKKSGNTILNDVTEAIQKTAFASPANPVEKAPRAAHMNLAMRLLGTQHTENISLPHGYVKPNNVNVHFQDVSVDGISVKNTTVESQRIRWRRPVSTSIFEIGDLHMNEYGCVGLCNISLVTGDEGKVTTQFTLGAIPDITEFFDRKGRYIVKICPSFDEASGLPDALTCEVRNWKGIVVGHGSCTNNIHDRSRLLIDFTFLGAGLYNRFESGYAVLEDDFSAIVGKLYTYDENAVDLRRESEEFVAIPEGKSFKQQLRNKGITKVDGHNPELQKIGKKLFKVRMDNPHEYAPIAVETEDGYLYVNGDLVSDFNFHEHELTWKRKLSNNSIETARFLLSEKHQLMFSEGNIQISPSSTARMTRSITVRSAQTSNAQLMASARQYFFVNGQIWKYGILFGYTANGTSVVRGINSQTGSYIPESACNATFTVINTKSILALTLTDTYLELFASDEKYYKVEATLGLLAKTSAGYIWSYVPGETGQKYPCTGNFEKTPPSRQTRSLPILRSQHVPDYSADDDGGDNQIVNVVTVPAQDISQSDKNFLMPLKLMSAPDPEAVNKISMMKIMSWAKHCMTDAQLKLLNLDRPVLTDLKVLEFLRDSKIVDFFRNKFAKAYIASGLKNVPDFKDSWNDSYDVVDGKLQFFWSGNSPNCLAHFPEYTAINHKASQLAYYESCKQNLDTFLHHHTVSAEDWAKRFYRMLVYNMAQFLSLKRMVVGGDRSQVEKYAMILYCLSPNTNLSTSFFTKVVMSSFAEKMLKLKVPADADLNLFLPHMFKAIIRKILDNTDGQLDDLKQEAIDALNELNIAINQSNADQSVHLFNSLSIYLMSASRYFVRAGTVISGLNRFLQVEAKISKRFPKASVFAKSLLGIATVGIGYYYTIDGLLEFDKLDITGKIMSVANTILMTADTGVGLLKATKYVVDMVKDWKTNKVGPVADIEMSSNPGGTSGPVPTDGENPLPPMDEYLGTSHNLDVELSTGRVAESFTETADVMAVDVDASLSDMSKASAGLARTGEVIAGRTAAEGGVEAASKFSRLLKYASTAAEALNVLVLVAVTVAIGFQVKADFDENASVSIKAIDITTLVVTAVAAVIAFATLFIASSVLPVVNLVLALVGAIFMIVSTILHKTADPPKTEQEKWIESEGNDFINSIPDYDVLFALSKYQEKPSPMYYYGNSLDVYLANVLKLSVNDIHNHTHLVGSYDSKSFSNVALIKSSNRELKVELDLNISLDDYIIIISSTKLRSMQSFSIETYSNLSWVHGFSSNPSEIFKHYFYRCKAKSVGGKWALTLHADNEFSISMARQKTSVTTHILSNQPAVDAIMHAKI